MSINSKLGYCNSVKESEVLWQYLNGKGGLVYTEFNTTHGDKGNLRALDAIRFPELEQGFLALLEIMKKLDYLSKTTKWSL
jgi:hypothetical protein